MTFSRACLFASAALIASGTAVPSGFAQTAVPAAPSAAKPDVSKPDVADLLFGNPQWTTAPIGSTITYSYVKKTADAAFGPSFDDTIKLKLDKAQADDRRTVEVKMFSGANAKPAGPFDSVAQNPILLLVLEENVQELSKLFKGNPRYLKNAIRKAWRDKAEITPTSIMIGGKSVQGTRIAIQPFIDDPEKDKMMGLDTISYIVELADSIPGQIATIDITGPTATAPKFSEVLHVQPEAKP